MKYSSRPVILYEGVVRLYHQYSEEETKQNRKSIEWRRSNVDKIDESGLHIRHA